MIEPLGPNMARSIFGEDYNPDYRYELETTEEGLQVIVTNKASGEASVRKLTDDAVESVHYDRLYDEDRERAIREYNSRSMRGALYALIAFATVCALACLAVYLISVQMGGAGA